MSTVKYPRTTHFRVVKKTKEVQCEEFRVIRAGEFVVCVKDSGLDEYLMNVLTIDRLLHEGVIVAVSYPPHESHEMAFSPDAHTVNSQCGRCMLQSNEHQIVYHCALSLKEPNASQGQ